VGIFYLAWHAYASDAIRKLSEADRSAVEDVVRDATRSFRDMVLSAGLFGEAAADRYGTRRKILAESRSPSCCWNR
jgi:hypothetical protein